MFKGPRAGGEMVSGSSRSRLSRGTIQARNVLQERNLC